MTTTATAPPATTASKRVGTRTMRFPSRPRIVAAACVGGRLEGEGPLGSQFDEIVTDSLAGQRSWEQAETELLRRAVNRALDKASLSASDMDVMFGGDLLNQIVSTTFAARDVDVPTLGLFSACATLTSALSLAAAMVDGGYARRVLVGVSSHHDSVERQYRFPTELGTQRPGTAQWTATAAAAFVVAGEGGGPAIAMATPGRIVDFGVKDPFDMGAAMAPAAADTIAAYFRDAQVQPDACDLILTGDLAEVGSKLVRSLLEDRGLAIADRHDDCGLMLYDRKKQDVHAGGSGTACSGSTLAAHIWGRLAEGELNRVLMAATGALHSPTTYQQGETIPAVAHAILLESPQSEGK